MQKNRFVVSCEPMNFLGRNVASARDVFANRKSGEAVHGLTDGSWGFVDALILLNELAGPKAHLAISTWAAATFDAKSIQLQLEDLNFKSVRFCLDVSFPKLRPQECHYLRQTFGDDAIRLAVCHAKFGVVTGGKLDSYFTTSANLNANPRIESFVAVFGGETPIRYREFIDDLFAVQVPKSAFSDPEAARYASDFLMKRGKAAQSAVETGGFPNLPFGGL